ncbi:hypothetical protein BP5796_03216 [Coleophoma crateriformis]|uniref:Wax synthase domain-containing protein n=1 Tax=Coleophoma crateriformis TaxID=565419 RepID=A0A3D8SML9_9HELO|nr:hypothetical protein BP5796_03216 [Coleophoma crateriformis]
MVSSSQSRPQNWLKLFDLHQFGTAFTCTVGVICCLAYATTQKPCSRIRWVMLVPTIGLALTTAYSVLEVQAFPPLRTVVGFTLGVCLALESINHLCVRRTFIDLKKTPCGRYTIHNALYQGADLVFNKRSIRTPYQVKGVPMFNSKNPSYVPSRSRFLVLRTARILVLNVVCSVLLSEPAPEVLSICRPVSRVAFPIRLVQGNVSVTEYINRFILTLGFLTFTILIQLAGYDEVSVIGVGLLNNDPADWPPRFDSITTAYNIRRFWNTFWHQDLRALLTCFANLVSDNVLRLPKRGVLQRYTKIYLCFGISGLLHIYGDKLGNVSLSETGVLWFFLHSATGILIEDLVKAVYHWAFTDRGFTSYGVGQPPRWQKILGYMWTLFYLTLVTPQWACPFMTGKMPKMPGLPV